MKVKVVVCTTPERLIRDLRLAWFVSSVFPDRPAVLPFRRTRPR